MLETLKFNVTFTSPELTITRDLNFQGGLTAITGPNGTGKSLVLEMIQYALWGTKALRAAVAEYKKLEVELTFAVRGEQFTVERSLKKASICGGDMIASGTTAVNAAILNIFGYSYDVFKVANVAAQGEIEALGNMKPAERKKLVDETVGLTALDDLSVYIQEHIRTLSAEVKATDAMLVEPKEPENPELASSEHYQKLKLYLREQIDARNKLKALVDQPLPAEPKLVEPEQDLDKKELYLQQSRDRDALLTERGLLEKERLKLGNTKYVAVKLDPEDGNLEVYERALADKRKIEAVLESLPPPASYTSSQLDQIEAQDLLLTRWRAKQTLMKQRVPHDCPNCHHKWDDEDPRIKGEFGDVPDDRPEYAELGPEAIGMERRKLEAMPKRKILEEGLADFPPELEADIDRIKKARKAFQDSQSARIAAARRKEIEDALSQLGVRIFNTPDRKDDIERLWRSELAVARYQEQKESFEKTMQQHNKAERELANYPFNLDNLFAEAELQLMRAFTYEMAHRRYLQEAEAYLAKKLELERTREELVDWEKGKKAVVDLRARVKGYLLPSLNTAASLLINEMTGGVLSWVVVNEDFDITVEGQKLETLSGGGKAVANLALRIGLGQILTNRVFSVLMLDEIDASCDQERAQYIAGCLQRLTGSIKQLVQVSHKSGLVADQHINLGEKA